MSRLLTDSERSTVAAQTTAEAGRAREEQVARILNELICLNKGVQSLRVCLEKYRALCQLWQKL